MYVCITRSFLVINICNQGNTLCSPCRREQRSSGLSGSEQWHLLIDVSRQNISSIFKVRLFETNQRSHLLGPLKIGLKICPETLVRNYHYSLRNSPKDRSFRENMCFEIWFSRDDAIQINPTGIWGRVFWKNIYRNFRRNYCLHYYGNGVGKYWLTLIISNGLTSQRQ